jgi:hypothetical protein
MKADSKEIERSLSVLYLPDHVVELRIPKTLRKGTISGYFDDRQKLIAALAAYDGQGPGTYTTLNPVHRGLLSRAGNHVSERALNTTSDVDILIRRWLLIDCDPKRPTGISSTDDEHALAIERAYDIEGILSEEGFPAPVVADSGNGGHLLYLIHLANDDDAKRLVEAVLATLSNRFSDPKVDIDRTVFNAARIVKAYGTVARKGEDSPGRPYRLARLLKIPLKLDVVDPKLLAEVANIQPKPNAKPQTHSNEKFHLESFIAKYLKAREPVAYQGGQKWVLEECPFNADHKAPDAAVFQKPDGIIGFKCQHNSCTGKHWGDVRALYQGTRRSFFAAAAAAAGFAGFSSSAKATPQPKPPPTLSTESGLAIFERLPPEPVPVVRGLLFPGLNLLAGRPKIGKSWLTLGLTDSLASGDQFGGELEIVGGKKRVLYLALEETWERTGRRLNKLRPEGSGRGYLDNVKFAYTIQPLTGAGGDELRGFLSSWPAEIVIIDSLFALLQLAGRKDMDMVQHDYNVINLLRQIASDHKLTMLVIHHARKMGGDAIDTVIGTSGVTAACDSVWNMGRGATGDMILSGRGRDHDEFTYSLKLESRPAGFGWWITGVGDAVMLSTDRGEILELLRHEAPLKPGKIALMLRKNANTIRWHVSELLKDGKVVKQGNGYVLSPFTT